MMPPPIVPRSIVALVAFVALLFAFGGVAAQGAAKPAAEPKAETPQARCAAANRQAVAELTQTFEAARNRNRLNPVMVSRLQAFEGKLGAMRAALPRDGRNLKDCEKLTQEIEAEQERLQRIAGPDPQVAECMARNQQAHSVAVQALAALPQAVRATSQAAPTRLAELKPALARDGQTLPDCRQTAAAIAQEQAQIQALAAAAATPAPDHAAIDACRAGNIDAYGDALRAWRDWASILGVTAGAAEYDAAMLRLRRLRDEVARPLGSLADCETLARAIAQERTRAPRGQGAPGRSGPPGAMPVPAAELPVRVAAPLPAAAPSAAAPGLTPGAAATAPVRAPAAPPQPQSAPQTVAPAPSARAAPVSAAAAGSAVRAGGEDCRVQHGQAYNDVVQRFTAATQGSALDEPARLRMMALSERLGAVHAALSGGAGSGDCAAIGQAVARARAELPP